LKRKISNKVQDNYGGIFTPPAAAAEGGLMFYLCFNFDIVKIFLTIPVAQISQNLPEPSLPTCKNGRTTAVDERSKVSFAIHQGTLPWRPIFVGFVHRIELWSR